MIVQLWQWFAVPLGMPEVGVLHTYGLLTLYGLVFARLRKNEDEPEMAECVAKAIVFPSMAWASGWIAHLFM